MQAEHACAQVLQLSVFVVDLLSRQAIDSAGQLPKATTFHGCIMLLDIVVVQVTCTCQAWSVLRGLC